MGLVWPRDQLSFRSVGSISRAPANSVPHLRVQIAGTAGPEVVGKTKKCFLVDHRDDDGRRAPSSFLDS